MILSGGPEVVNGLLWTAHYLFHLGSPAGGWAGIVVLVVITPLLSDSHVVVCISCQYIVVVYSFLFLFCDSTSWQTSF